MSWVNIACAEGKKKKIAGVSRKAKGRQASWQKAGFMDSAFWVGLMEYSDVFASAHDVLVKR